MRDIWSYGKFLLFSYIACFFVLMRQVSLSSWVDDKPFLFRFCYLYFARRTLSHPFPQGSTVDGTNKESRRQQIGQQGTRPTIIVGRNYLSMPLVPETGVTAWGGAIYLLGIDCPLFLFLLCSIYRFIRQYYNSGTPNHARARSV